VWWKNSKLKLSDLKKKYFLRNIFSVWNISNLVVYSNTWVHSFSFFTPLVAPSLVLFPSVLSPTTVFPLYPLLLHHTLSEPFQNVPFCSVEHALQDYTLLTASTPTLLVLMVRFLPPSPLPVPIQNLKILWSQVRWETVNKSWSFRVLENQTRKGPKTRKKSENEKKCRSGKVRKREEVPVGWV
jgi:hypothetical protein